MPRMSKAATKVAVLTKALSAAKKQARMGGSGGYYSDVIKPFVKKHAGKALRAAGESIGSYVAGPAGGVVGRKAGKFLSRLVGAGKYSVSKNTLTRQCVMDANGNLPVMHSKQDYVRVRYREYIGDVSCLQTVFNSTSYNIQPGLPPGVAGGGAFPWVNLIANAFEEWEPKGMVFYYKASTANAISSTNGSLGTVIMSTDYDANNVAFNSKQAMLNTEYTSDNPPTKDIIHLIECERKQNQKSVYYCRSGPLPADENILDYDLGVFQIATQGQQAAFDCGELYVIYDIIFRKLYVNPTIGALIGCAHYTLNSATNAAPMTGHTLLFDNIGCTLSNTVITLPPNLSGNFVFWWLYTGSNAAVVAPSITVLSTLSFTKPALIDADGQSTFQYPNSGVTANCLAFTLFVSIAANGITPTITLGGAGTLPASVTGGDLFIYQYSAAMTS